MNKVIHFFVILFMFFSPLAPVHAVPSADDRENYAPSTSAQNPYRADTVQQPDGKDRQLPEGRNSDRYDPNNPAYFNSLRWLVYALILFLPFSPSRASSPAANPSGINTGVPVDLHE